MTNINLSNVLKHFSYAIQPKLTIPASDMISNNQLILVDHLLNVIDIACKSSVFEFNSESSLDIDNTFDADYSDEKKVKTDKIPWTTKLKIVEYEKNHSLSSVMNQYRCVKTQSRL
jgi:hypothetical protein